MHTFTLRERILAWLNLLPLPVYDVFAAPLLGHSVALAIRFNLFEALTQPQTSEQIAKTLNIHPQASSLLLSTLVIAGYVKRKDHHFSLSASGKKWFLRSSPTYLGNFVRYVELLYTHWLYLDETIQQGEPPTTYFESFGEKEWETYVYGMMDLAKIIFPHIASKLKLPNPADLSAAFAKGIPSGLAEGGTTHIIDLGGSHGLYSIELCQRHPQLHATIVDVPQALKFTQRIVHDHNITDRITLQPGDILEIAFEKNLYDAALAFNIVHGLTKEQNARLLENISRVLKPGCCLYILDQSRGYRGSTTEQFIPLMVGMNIMNEVGGSVYSIADVCGWLLSAGFESTKVFRLRLPGVFLLRTQKRH